MTVALSGSPKQRAYALRILQSYVKAHPERTFAELLKISNSSTFWVSNRENLEAILSGDADSGIDSPFTQQFPRYSPGEAFKTVKQLSDIYLLDVETVGLEKNDDIIQVAIVHYPSLETKLDTLIAPTDLEAFRKSVEENIHGITAEMIEQAPTFLHIAGELERLLAEKHLVIFNANFDGPRIQQMYFRHRLPIPQFSATCLMRLVTAYAGLSMFLSLDEACQLLEIDTARFGTRHTALADCLIEAELLSRLQELSSEGRE